MSNGHSAGVGASRGTISLRSSRPALPSVENLLRRGDASWGPHSPPPWRALPCRAARFRHCPRQSRPQPPPLPRRLLRPPGPSPSCNVAGSALKISDRHRRAQSGTEFGRSSSPSAPEPRPTLRTLRRACGAGQGVSVGCLAPACRRKPGRRRRCVPRSRLFRRRYDGGGRRRTDACVRRQRRRHLRVVDLPVGRQGGRSGTNTNGIVALTTMAASQKPRDKLRARPGVMRSIYCRRLAWGSGAGAPPRAAPGAQAATGSSVSGIGGQGGGGLG